MSMNWRLTAAATAASIVLSGAAQADILSGGPAYAAAGGTGGVLVCALFNAGTQSMTVSYRQIYDQLGNLQSLVSDTCTATVAAGKSCFYEAQIPSGTFLSCRAVTNGIDNNVSGAIELFNSTGQLLGMLPMHR